MLWGLVDGMSRFGDGIRGLSSGFKEEHDGLGLRDWIFRWVKR